MSRTVVITGASGFIGGAAARALRTRGCTVVAASRAGFPNYGFDDVFRGADCLHLAGDNVIGSNVPSAQLLRETNALARRITGSGFARIVFASSAAVYVPGPGLRREDDPVSPSSAYAAAKLAAERIMLDAGQMVLRLANVYGSGMSQRTLMGDVARQLDVNGPIRIRNGGNARDYVHVDDIAGAFALALGSFAPGIFNIGSGVATPARAVAAGIAAAAGEPARAIVSDVPDTPGDDLALDAGKAQGAFGWQPAIGLSDGLRTMFAQPRERRLA